MKKLFLLPIAIFLMINPVKSQNTTFTEGDKVLNLGVGVVGAFYSGVYANKIPPLVASLEFNVKDELFDENSSLGVGALIGYTGAKWDGYGIGWSYSNMLAGAQGALHYQFVDKLDTYVGLLIGYSMMTVKSVDNFGGGGDFYATLKSTTASSSVKPVGGIIYGFRIGGRYYFSDKIAAMAELGYGISNLNIGVALKL